MSGPNGDLEPARPHLDVEFTNMGMRLKGTGKKVLAGVTGRLRASHLTAIMGPSGAGQQFDTVFGTSQRQSVRCHKVVGGALLVWQHCDVAETLSKCRARDFLLCGVMCMGMLKLAPSHIYARTSRPGTHSKHNVSPCIRWLGHSVPKGQLSLMLRCIAVGKTSLMSALAGKACYGTVTGSVTINGKPDKLLRYKRVMGFVPQVSPAVHFKLTKLLAH